jgi:hypothetical protein
MFLPAVIAVMLLSTLSSTAFRPVLGRMGSRSLSMVSEGAEVPNVVFKARVRDESIGGSNPFTWKDVSSADLFKGKRSVVFALPGGY